MKCRGSNTLEQSERGTCNSIGVRERRRFLLFYFTMSTEGDEAADIMCCASCGIAAVDNVKLKKCACGLVKYCSIACQKNHRSKHKKMCKKRLAELRDKDLFMPPDSSCYGDCPICCLPLSLDLQKSTMI